MTSALKEFETGVMEHWLPSFCSARADDITKEGFKVETIKRISEHDAHWFLRAIKNGYVTEKDGIFTNPRFQAKEQIFWEGKKGDVPRALTLWAEPVITFGVIAKLIEDFGWPLDLVGAQSEYPWAFDFVCYRRDGTEYDVAGEVKKSKAEVEKLIELMLGFSQQEPMEIEPRSGSERNACRKVKGIRVNRPRMFCAIGPDGHSRTFEIEWTPDNELFALREVPLEMIKFRPR